MTSDPMHLFFRHCEKPTDSPVTGQVTGEIPDWLEGTLYRNGPGIKKIGNQEFRHAFDGMAILHRFNIKNGNATYQNRALESDAYAKNLAAERIVVSEFGTSKFDDPCVSIFDRFKAFFNMRSEGEEMTDNCCVNVGFYGDQLYAMTETNSIRRISPEDLTSIGGKTKINEYVAMNTASAHPHVLKDGTVLNMGTAFRGKNSLHYCIVEVPPSHNSDVTSYEKAKIVAQIPWRWKMNPSYFHSFGMSENYIIFIESPLCLNVPKLATAAFRKLAFVDTMTWYGKEKTRMYLVNRKNGQMHPVVYEADAFFTFHHINAYEENEQVVVDVAAYNNADVIFGLIEKNVGTEMAKNASAGATARRFVFPLNIPKEPKASENLVTIQGVTAKASVSSRNTNGDAVIDCIPQHLSKRWIELPRINYSLNGMKYNFFYGVSSDEKNQNVLTDLSKIVKVDIEKGTEIAWEMSDCSVTEPIFVANPKSETKDEDDGVILIAVLPKSNQQQVYLVVLDAKNLSELAKVKFEAEGVVTATFHGLWAQNGNQTHLY